MPRRGDARNCQTLSSSKIRGPIQHSGGTTLARRVLNRKHIIQQKEARLLEQEIRFIGTWIAFVFKATSLALVDMNSDVANELHDLQGLVDISNQPDDDDGDWIMLDGVLRGTTALELSNSGGEMEALLQRLSEACAKIKRCVFSCSCLQYVAWTNNLLQSLDRWKDTPRPCSEAS